MTTTTPTLTKKQKHTQTNTPLLLILSVAMLTDRLGALQDAGADMRYVFAGLGISKERLR